MDTPAPTRRHARARPTAHGAAQRQAIVLAAYGLIAEGGFERLRTREVASRAGLNVATLHYYFPTKEDLVRAVVAYLDGEFETAYVPGPETRESAPLQELRNDLGEGPRLAQSSPRTWVVWFEIVLRSLRDPSIRDLVHEAEGHWRRHIESYLRAGVEGGTFRADLDVSAVAAALVALISGSALQAMSDPQAFPTDRVLSEIERWLTGHMTP